MVYRAVYNYFAIAEHCNGVDKIPFGNNFIKAASFMKRENESSCPRFHVTKIVAEFSHWSVC